MEDEIIKKEEVAKKPVKINKIVNTVIEILAIMFWLYLIFKIFIFDIDFYLINNFSPNYAWIVSYKFFILIGALSLIWIFSNTKTILLPVLYIIFYPFIIIFFKIPFYLFKNKGWNLAISIINVITSFFQSIKYNFVVASIFLIASAMSINANNPFLLYLAMVCMLTILFIEYIRRFLLIFKPNNIFKLFSKLMGKIQKFTQKNFSLDKKNKRSTVAGFY